LNFERYFVRSITIRRTSGTTSTHLRSIVMGTVKKIIMLIARPVYRAATSHIGGSCMVKVMQLFNRAGGDLRKKEKAFGSKHFGVSGTLST
jgi:hypothetical protein